MPLTIPVSEWANAALEAAKLPRRDTADDFKTHGYDIESVAKEFLSLLGAN